MRSRRTMLAIAGLAWLAISCTESTPTAPGPLTSADALVGALRQQGATVVLGELLPMAMPCFSVTGRLVRVNSGGANVFEYPSIAAADNDATKVCKGSECVLFVESDGPFDLKIAQDKGGTPAKR